jgi:hypothetical protein
MVRYLIVGNGWGMVSTYDGTGNSQNDEVDAEHDNFLGG